MVSIGAPLVSMKAAQVSALDVGDDPVARDDQAEHAKHHQPKRNECVERAIVSQAHQRFDWSG